MSAGMPIFQRFTLPLSLSVHLSVYPSIFLPRILQQTNRRTTLDVAYPAESLANVF